MSQTKDETKPKQLLHLVFGGELKDLEGNEFVDLKALDIVGIFPNYAEAVKAWRAAAQRTVDQAQTRYFVVHMHRLLEPDHDEKPVKRTPAMKARPLLAKPKPKAKPKAKPAAKKAPRRASPKGRESS